MYPSWKFSALFKGFSKGLLEAELGNNTGSLPSEYLLLFLITCIYDFEKILYTVKVVNQFFEYIIKILKIFW